MGSILPSALQFTHAWAAALAGGLALLAFLNSLGNGFVMDDHDLIVRNPLIRTLANLPAILTTPYWPREYIDGMYRPLLVLTYALNYAVGGLRPLGYHLVNVLLHAGNSALVYALAWQLFRQRGLALAAAAAFALHPIHTEAVANVVGRAELLAAACVLLAWLLYLRRDPAAPAGRAWWLPLSVLSFALALLAKEHAIVLPGLLLLSDTLRLTQQRPAPAGAARGRTLGRRLLTVYPAYLAVAAAFVLLRTAVVGTLTMQKINWVLNPLASADPLTRLLTALRVLGRELGLLLVPLRLSADYSYNQVPLATSVFEPDVLLPLLSAGLIAWCLRRRAPAVPFGLLVGLVALAPVANLVFPIGSVMAERQLYLPSVGFCLALAGVVVLATERLAAPGAPRWLPALPVGAFVLLLAGYAGKTVARNPAWATDLGLWRATVATSPRSAKAPYSLGRWLFEAGELEGARRAMEAALRIHPTWLDAQHYLGLILSRQGRWDEAIAAHQASIRLDPEAPEAYYNLARAYEMKGMLAEAREAFERAAELALLRKKPLLYLGIGDFLGRRGQLAEAERWFEKATQAWPDYLNARLFLGYVYWKQGRSAEAQAAFERALRLDPNSAKGHEGMGLVLMGQRRKAEAEREFQLARQAESRPDNGTRDSEGGIISSLTNRP